MCTLALEYISIVFCQYQSAADQTHAREHGKTTHGPIHIYAKLFLWAFYANVCNTRTTQAHTVAKLNTQPKPPHFFQHSITT